MSQHSSNSGAYFCPGYIIADINRLEDATVLRVISIIIGDCVKQYPSFAVELAQNITRINSVTSQNRRTGLCYIHVTSLALWNYLVGRAPSGEAAAVNRRILVPQVQFKTLDANHLVSKHRIIFQEAIVRTTNVSHCSPLVSFSVPFWVSLSQIKEKFTPYTYSASEVEWTHPVTHQVTRETYPIVWQQDIDDIIKDIYVEFDPNQDYPAVEADFALLMTRKIVVENATFGSRQIVFKKSFI